MRYFQVLATDYDGTIAHDGMVMFVEIGAGVDADTYLFHLRNGDFESWMRSSIKDDELADEVANIGADEDIDVVAARDLVQIAIQQRYTAPVD